MEITHLLSFKADVTVNEVKLGKRVWYRFWQKPKSQILEYTKEHTFTLGLKQDELDLLLSDTTEKGTAWRILFRALANQDVDNISHLQVETIAGKPTEFIMTGEPNAPT